MLPEAPLELDESQLFGEDEVADLSVRSPALESPGAPAAAHLRHLPADSDASQSDDDGIVLESECSSSDDEVERELADRLQSLQSSLEGAPATLAGHDGEGRLGTSHSSQVGSLKSFGGGAGLASFQQASGRRLFGSSPDLAASLPVHVSGGMAFGRRRVAPAAESAADRADRSAAHLGTSMPISIPMMPRRGSGADLGDGGSGGRAAAGPAFVPPHVLSRQESDLGGSGAGGALGGEGSGLSPTTAAKREKLLARNAILRSTGFLEVQHSAPAIGEVLDPVKEQLLGALPPSLSAPQPMPGLRPDSRSTARSSLTQLLGTSK